MGCACIGGKINVKKNIGGSTQGQSLLKNSPYNEFNKSFDRIQEKSKNSSFKINIYIPNSENESVTLSLVYDKPYMTLPNLINSAIFNSNNEKIDPNFINCYNPVDDDFDYIIERMYGYGIDNDEGKNWNIYINDNLETWSLMCRNNRIVSKGDKIEFKFE